MCFLCLRAQGHFTFSRPEGGKQQLAPAVISEHVSGHPWRRTVTGFDGTEVEGDDIPSWVVECVLHSRLPAQRDMKCAFVLQPAEGSALPAMLQTRLNAPRILRISKVASYTVSKLSEQDINMAVQPPGVQPGSEEAKQVAALPLFPFPLSPCLSR
jgi:WD repeat-containing protein 48